MGLDDLPEHPSAKQLAAVTGRTPRYFQQMFEQKRIKWARQPGGPGSPIYFERAGFLDWFIGANRDGGKPWRASTGATGVRGAARAIKVRKYDSPLEQRLKEKLRSFSKRGSRT